MTNLRRWFLSVLTAILAGVILFIPSVASAQSTIQNAIQAFGKQNVEGYLQPAADLFGANINSGYYHTAAIPMLGFNLSLDIVGMAAPVSDAQKTYTATTPAGFNPTSFQTATIFGGKGTLVTDPLIPSIAYRGSDGVFNTKMFPFAVPQLTVGSVMGTEAIVRYVALPKIGSNKIPSTSLWSIGARHSISQYIPLAPLDIAVGILYTKFKSGDLFDANGLTYGAQASKTFSVLTIHGGVNLESSKLKITYTSTDPNVPGSVEIDLTGKRKASFTAGIDLALGIFHLFGNANFGSPFNYTAGIGFGG